MSEGYYYPAPSTQDVLMYSCGKDIHSVFDCVWDFEQVDLDDSTAELCATHTPFRMLKSKTLPVGVKQAPTIYQHCQDNAFASKYKPKCYKVMSLCNGSKESSPMGFSLCRPCTKTYKTQ